MSPNDKVEDTLAITPMIEKANATVSKVLNSVEYEDMHMTLEEHSPRIRVETRSCNPVQRVWHRQLE